MSVDANVVNIIVIIFAVNGPLHWQNAATMMLQMQTEIDF